MTVRRTLRLLAVVGAYAAASYVAPSAHSDATITWTSCSAPATPTPSGAPPTQSPAPTTSPTPQDCTPSEGSRIVGTQRLRFEVRTTADRPLKQVLLFIESQEEGIPHANADEKGRAQPVLDKLYTRDSGTTSDILSFDWDSYALTTYNGSYRLRATAITYGPSPNGSDTQSFTTYRRDMRVDNPPKTLAAPRVVATTETKMTVEWDKAIEPDVLSYKLFVAKTDSGDKPPPYSEFKEEVSTPETTARDDVQAGRFYWYSVVVTRRSVVTPQTGISSAPSPISKAGQAKAVGSTAGGGEKQTTGRIQPRARIVSRLPSLTLPSVSSRAPPVPDAPFSAFLPYDVPEGGKAPDQAEPGAGDPRGPVLPVAVGAFLVSSALALGRMPY